MSERPLDELIEGLLSERSFSSRSPARAAAAAEFARELERSRRYERTFTIVQIDPEHQSWMSAWTGTGWRVRVVASALGFRLRSHLRSVDRVWALREQVYVLMPECDRVQAVHALKRIAQVDPGLLHPDHVRIATFPADGLTISALLRALQPLGSRALAAPLEPTVGDS